AVRVAGSREQRPPRGDVERQEESQLERLPELDEAAQSASVLRERARVPVPGAERRDARERRGMRRADELIVVEPVQRARGPQLLERCAGVIEPARLEPHPGTEPPRPDGAPRTLREVERR